MPIELLKGVDCAKLRFNALKRCNCSRTREATTTTIEIAEAKSTGKDSICQKPENTETENAPKAAVDPYYSVSKIFRPIKSFLPKNLRRNTFWSIMGCAPRPLFLFSNKIALS